MAKFGLGPSIPALRQATSRSGAGSGAPCNRHRKINQSLCLFFSTFILIFFSGQAVHVRGDCHPSLTLTDGDIICGGMAAQSHGNTQVALHFPNASRHFNVSQRCICFWGHDSASEISFHLDEDALFRMSPHAERDDASLLHVFDVNSARIHETARVAYSRQPQNYYRLSSDLVEPVHRAGKRD